MASFLHVTRVEIVSRKSFDEERLSKLPSRRVYVPVKNELVLQHEAENVVANNYLKAKKTLQQQKQRRRLRKPYIFPNYYTNREVLKIPCFTYPR